MQLKTSTVIGAGLLASQAIAAPTPVIEAGANVNSVGNNTNRKSIAGLGPATDPGLTIPGDDNDDAPPDGPIAIQGSQTPGFDGPHQAPPPFKAPEDNGNVSAAAVSLGNVSAGTTATAQQLRVPPKQNVENPPIDMLDAAACTLM